MMMMMTTTTTPHYLSDMVTLMEDSRADLTKLSAFSMYAPRTQFFGYMDLKAKVGHHHQLTGGSASPIEFHEKMQIGADFILFYGSRTYIARRLPQRRALTTLTCVKTRASSSA
jgi:hypothetical protein